MTNVPPLVAYDLVVGILASLGLSYLLYARRAHLLYRPPIIVSFVGLFVFVLGDPLTQLFYRPAIHFVQGVSALLIAYGMYDPMHNRLRRTEWSVFLLRDPSVVRSNPDWMTPMDDHVLQTLKTSELVLTPSIIALNIDRSREAVSRRLTELSDRGFVERVDRGKYEITTVGEQYLDGELPVRESEDDTRSSLSGDD
ncbi:ArsR family transcriptional regulator [Natronococcus pandeyae]|nr:ArsR family transcriptional regulator [Natronococcus pandeyae]